MIRHIVFFSVPLANRKTAYDGLKLLTAIPYAKVLEVGFNSKTDPLSQEVDLVVYGEFESQADLVAYKAHPLYQKSIEIVRPLREMRIAADFEVGEASEV